MSNWTIEMSKEFLFCLLLISPFQSGAYDVERTQKEFIGSSNLVVVKVVPRDRKAEVFLTGIKAAELSPQLVSVTLFDGPQSKPLQFRMSESRYELDLPPRKTKSYDLEFETETQGKKERIKVSIP